MAQLYILMGNIGTGKSTYAKKLKHDDHNIEIICSDQFKKELEKEMSNSNRDFLCKLQRRVYSTLREFLIEGKDVVFDGNHMTKSSRCLPIQIAKHEGAKITIINFGKGDKQSLHRRINLSKNISADDWEKIHNQGLKEYEHPDENVDNIIHLESTWYRHNS